MSLLWYYRPEHLDCGRRSCDQPDEIYASKHRDHTSVACIEDKCYVMTFNEYCRYVIEHCNFKNCEELGPVNHQHLLFSNWPLGGAIAICNDYLL